ncbi:MAG TPA: hypothetical protein VEV81_09820, partial [Pyrinomonadaceae bacterium]|nr:hypothetical protein [Pyrinomonadaceae bacterium]
IDIFPKNRVESSDLLGLFATVIFWTAKGIWKVAGERSAQLRKGLSGEVFLLNKQYSHQP